MSKQTALSGISGQSGFSFKEEDEKNSNRINNYKDEDLNWDLEGKNQVDCFGETRVRKTRTVHIMNFSGVFGITKIPMHERD